MRRPLLIVTLVAAAVLAPETARAGDPPVWMFSMDAAHGPRFEVQKERPPSFNHARNDIGRGFSMGLVFGRVFSSGLVLLAIARPPVWFEGEAAIGAGIGFERRIAARSPIRLFGVVEGGYKALFNDACECGGLTYEGPWARGEVGIRGRLVEAFEPGLRLRHHTFDLYASAALGFDLVAARYPDGSQYGRHVDDRGIRLGVDPSLGVGFVW